MTNLSTIPAEIIACILPFVLPDDLENFAQCCKAVYEQASRKKSNDNLSILQNHRSFIHKYSILNDLEDVGPFLKALAADHRVVRYVRKMDFGTLRKDVNVDSWDIQDVLEDEEIFDILLEAAKTIDMDKILAIYLSEMGVHELRQRRECTNLMACSNTDVAIALLLPLLPNLNSLSFCWSWEVSADIWRWIVTGPKLEEVGVLAEGWGHTMTDIVRMTAPPCLHNLAIAVSHHPLSPSARFLWSQRQSSLPNTVKDLKLWCCDVYDPVFYDYVGSFKGLESFSFRGKLCVPQHLDLAPVFAVLPSRYVSTLTKLSFYIYRDEIVPKLVFKELKVLKDLDVDWSMLLPSPYVARENWARWLPQNLEKLTIHDFGWNVNDWNTQYVLKHFRPVVDDLISYKVAGLLRVKEFSFTAEFGLFYSEGLSVDLEGIEEVALGFFNDCLPVGIRFSFKDHEV